jgi:hypothetical protein
MKCEEAEDGVEGIGDRWWAFVTLLQAVWESGTIPTQITWMIIVLLPKGRGNDCGIGLLDPIWKVVEKVMVAQFSVIKLHDCLHGGLPGRGTGTAIMEVKLQQQLAWVDQEPLYQIYLDLRKAYDALDRGRCLEILAGYCVGPNLLRLQKKFWDDAKMVCCAGGNCGLPFGAHRGVTQGGPLSSLVFMFVSTVSLGSGSGRCWVKTSLEMGWGIWCVINVSHFWWTTPGVATLKF